MKEVLVIVVTYNGLPWLERCLGSVYSDADVFAVDNDSTDGSADYVQAHFPEAHLLRSADNLGFSKANNLGLHYAQEKGYRYVYLLNQDAWLAPGALALLLDAAAAHPDYAILSPLQMTDGYAALDSQFAKILRSAQNDREPLAVDRVMAAHWLIPVKALEEIGLFEEELFPMYGQDDDWCHRAKKHGWKVGIVPAAKAVHDRSQREENKEKLIFRNYYSGSLVRLCDINRPLWERFLYVVVFTFVKAVKYRSLLPFKYFRKICRQLPAVRQHRRDVR